MNYASFEDGSTSWGWVGSRSLAEVQVRRPFGLIVLMALLCASQTAAAAEKKAREIPDPIAREWTPPQSAAGALDLEEAVRLAIANDPNLRLAETDRDFSLGLLQEAQGQFDLRLTSSIRGEYNQDSLTESQLEPLREQRDMLGEDVEISTFQAELLTQSQLLVQRLQTNPDLNSLAPEELAFLDPDFVTNLGLLNVLIDNAAGDAALLQQLQGLRGDSIGSEIELLSGLIDDARADALRAQDELDMLGGVPDIDESWSGNVSLGFEKAYRNGLRLGPSLDLTGEGSNFKGKPSDPQKGGKGIPDLYTGRIGFSLNAPLLKGRGRVSTGAFERAAEIDFDASEASLLHGAAQTVLSAAAGYWNLVAAQKRLEVSEASLARQARLTELSRGLIEADELPAAEMPRIDARMAGARSLVESARNGVQVAAIELARALGLELAAASEAPSASAEFPEVLPGMDWAPPASLVSTALVDRQDLVAARRLEESGRVLLAAADRDLSATLDFNTDWSFGNAVDDSFSDLFSDSWVGPSATASLDYSRPFGNNSPKGFFRQQEAVVLQSQISARNLERLIRSNVAEIWQSLIDTRAQIEFARAAVEAYNRTVEDEFERFRLGSATLIDAILTEERTTDALLTLIGAQQRYATLLARLRFETGTLVAIEGSGSGRVEQGVLTTLPQVSR